MNVTPTRMELSKFKKRLKTSKEAHKLLKDKQDELMRRFIALTKETNALRSQVNLAIKIYSSQAGLSVAGFPYKMVENLFLVKEILISADIGKKNWMGVSVADISYEIKQPKPSSALVSSPLLSKTEHDIRALLPTLLKLTVTEKNCRILAKEIETLRRRVNALEHMIIPDLAKNIQVIKMKLGDGERDTITRLIKVKRVKSKKFLPNP
ncbi:MAG: V-type ATP synthase subunit D [Oscillospiraceae bacterium]|jgi:V/A-type H+-transporting ATPase subunit D|nr:V-type ATP synthase subunit D [Oscillospiraceae bacterium]